MFINHPKGRKNREKKSGMRGCVFLSFLFALSSTQFRFVLFAETVSDGEEVPTTLLVHVPYIGLLTSVFRVRFVDQMHQEEPACDNRIQHQLADKHLYIGLDKGEANKNSQIVSQIVLLLDVRIEPVWNRIKVILSYTANEALGLEIFRNAGQLVTQFSESINNQTCCKKKIVRHEKLGLYT